MKLTVVIVNYNVCYYLEQCLLSVQKALEGIEGEIYVVDNHSKDGSVAYLSARFPAVHFIDSNHNLGFARANNIAIRQSWVNTSCCSIPIRLSASIPSAMCCSLWMPILRLGEQA